MEAFEQRRRTTTTNVRNWTTKSRIEQRRGGCGSSSARGSARGKRIIKRLEEHGTHGEGGSLENRIFDASASRRLHRERDASGGAHVRNTCGGP
jgi:molybdenum-dependent DNA-binding transcriptional regulator ModE